MRSTTAAQDTALAANVRGEFVQIEVQNADGTWIDLTNLAGFDWVMRWSVSWGVEQPIPEARVYLARDRSDANRSLAPLREDSPLNVDDAAAYAPILDGGRGLRINVAVMAWGSTPGASDWVRLFTGEIDDVESGQPEIEVVARSRIGVQIGDRFIETETVYGSEAGTAMETVMQSILTDWTDDPVSLYTPASPSFNVVSTPFKGISVLEALNRISALRGWVVRERWHDGTSQFRLTLQDPDRAKTAPDHTIGPEDYWDVETLRIGRHNVRNAIRLTYVDGATGATSFVTAEDATSIARYGRKPLLITEGSGSPIDTAAEAQAMADAALADLKDPVAEKRVSNRFFWPAQLGDLYTFSPNGVHYSVAQDMAVTHIRHQGEGGMCTTTLDVRGAPIGFNHYWRRVGREQDLRNRPEVEDISYKFNTSDELVVSVRTDGGSVRVAAGATRPTDGTVDGSTLQVVDSDGVAQVNLGSGYPTDVVVAVRAWEFADGSGAYSEVAVSDVFKVTYLEAAGGTIGGWSLDADSIDATGFSLNSATRRLLIGAATAVLTGVGIFAGHVGDGTYDLRAGDPAGDYFHWDESATRLYVSGEIEAGSGSIGGWSVTATDIVSPLGNIRLESDTERILLGDATAPLVGIGAFLGESGGLTQFRVGDPAGDYFLFDGTAIVLGGEIVNSSNIVPGAVTLGALEFSGGTVMDVLEVRGTGNNNPGNRRVVVGGRVDVDNTGRGVTLSVLKRSDHTSLTYRRDGSAGTLAANQIYDTYTATDTDRAALEDALIELRTNGNATRSAGEWGDDILVILASYDASDFAIGSGPTLVAELKNHGGSSALSQITGSLTTHRSPFVFIGIPGLPEGRAIEVISGVGTTDPPATYTGLLLDGNLSGFGALATGKVTANLIAADTITASEIASLSFTGKTATFDTGSVGGWLMSADTLSSGSVTIDAANERITLGAASAPMTGVGIFMGSDGLSGYDFRVGDPLGEYIWFDASASTFEVNVESFTAANPVFDGSVAIEGGAGNTRVLLSQSGGVGGVVRFYDNSGAESGEIEGASSGLWVKSEGDLIFSTEGGSLSKRYVQLVNGWGVLHKVLTTRTDAVTVGTSTLETITIPASTIATGGGVRLRCWGNTTGTASQRYVNILWDGVQVFQQYLGSTFSDTDWYLIVDIHSVGTTSQRLSVMAFWGAVGTQAGDSRPYSDPALSSANTGDNAVDLVIQAQMGNGGDAINLHGSIVELIP